MKKPERVKKVVKWGLVCGISFLGIVAPFALASAALQLAPVHLAFAQMLARIPLVPFWLPFVPQGKMGNFPTSFVVVGALAIVFAIFTSRLHHHWNRLGQENLKRDLEDV